MNRIFEKRKFPLSLLLFLMLSGSAWSQTCTNCGVNQANPQSSLHVTGCGSTFSTSAFRVDNSIGKTLLFLQDDQKAGIGTKALFFKLEVADTGIGGSPLNILRLQNLTTATLNNASQLLFGLKRTTNGMTNIAGVSGLITDIGASSYKGSLVFSTANNAEPAERIRINEVGNVGIGTALPVANARLAIKDGHVQAQQTTAPVVGTKVTYTTASLTNATDVAGNLSITTTAAAGSVTFNYNKTYTVAPIVLLTPTVALSAADFTKVYVTSTTSGFTVNFAASPAAGVHTFSYVAIETQ